MGDYPGEKAAIALFVTASLGASIVVTPRLRGKMHVFKDGRMRAVIGIALFTSPVFWAWAVHHTIKGTFDGGTVTFALAFAAAVASALSVNETRARYSAIALAAAGGLVSLNYIAGVAVYKDVGRKSYCVFGALVWALVGLGAASWGQHTSTSLAHEPTQDYNPVVVSEP